MTECSSGEMRDLLPDLLHGRLDAGARGMVEVHLAHCAECRDELVLLGHLRATLQRGIAVDAGTIAAMIPPYRAPVRRNWGGWRAAAAVALITVGATSVAVARHSDTTEGRIPDTRSVVATAPASMPSIVSGPAEVRSAAPSSPATEASHSMAPATVPASAARELAVGGAVGDLSDRELKALVADMESLNAIPLIDAEPSTPLAPVEPARGAS